ncbi:MAG: transporter substrate-binding domain-containing protein [Desulfuromonadaceae bacterium]|nr:transporter substrate-binding domain-containing protein [Desulfuromonas sp.]MDY0185925.1 transporter substrate-binding domain-containing protein [Desulfuromonadaceae bacterium]
MRFGLGLRTSAWLLLLVKMFLVLGAQPLQAESLDTYLPNLTVEERNFLQAQPRFKVHVERGYHPFAYVKNGEARGFAVDLTNILARRLGIEVEYITDQSWEEAMTGLKAQEIDIVLSMVDTPARREFAYFTDPFLTTYTGLATRKNAPTSKTLESLCGHRLGVIRGYWFEAILRQYYPQIEVVTFPDHTSCLEALASGSIDAVISSNPVLTYHIRQHYMLSLETWPVRATEFFLRVEEGYGVRKDMPLLAAALQKALDSIPDESMDELRQRWQIDDVSEPSVLSLSGEERRHLENLGEIRLCIDPDKMPLEGVDPQGNYTGLSSDFFALLQAQLPIPIRFIPTASWTETLQKAENGECDLLALVSPTLERKKFLNFTRPYLHIPLVVATKGEELFVEDIRQLSGRRIGSVRGYAATERFRKRYPAIELVETQNVALGIRMVNRGELYGFIGTVAAIGEAIRDQGLDDVKISGHANMTLELGIGVRKDDPLLCDVMDRAIVAVGPGEGQRLYNRWVAVTYRQGVNFLVVFFSGIGAIILLAVFVVRNRRLTHLHSELLKAHQQLEEKSQELKRLSVTDSLTGLYNRRKIEIDFTNECLRMQRYPSPLSVVLLDIDHFKKVNDTFGHQAGDRVLCGIAEALRCRVRTSDIVGRWGGEEFMLVLPQTTLTEAAALAEDLRREIQTLDFSPVPPQSASFGVATVEAGDDHAGVFKRADRALYRAKDGGRNMVVTQNELPQNKLL